MKRLLLTGASGFLGYNIAQLAREDWEVHGVVLSHPVAIPGVRIVRADLAFRGELGRLFREIRPHAVIHTAAMPNANICQAHPDETSLINTRVPVEIAALCGDLGIDCVFTSTDLVFDGRNAPYGEDAPTSPVSVYGEQKVRAEEGMLECCPSALVCRMPLMFGDRGPASASFLQPMFEAVREGREIKLFVDEFRTPASGEDAARGILLALSSGGRGILHLGGPERISRYDFGLLLMEVFGVTGARLRACRQSDVPMAAPRPSDVSLDSSRAFRLGYRPDKIRDALERLARRAAPFAKSPGSARNV
ncbi:MAG: NAD(P)-dependent oxidoreductase [Syntrophobacteraceae bacterium]|nr:NAD(P)-dependent oxidoreductase [Desulfobacteraceae bacterium]